MQSQRPTQPIAVNKELLKGNIDLIILSVVKQNKSYGYEISKAIKKVVSNSFVIQEATIYLSLKRLHEQGAITATWGDESGGGRRRYYEITEMGVELLDVLCTDYQRINLIVKKFTGDRK